MKILLALLCLLMSPLGVAFASSPRPPDAEGDARAESVQIGYVVGEHWPDYEAKLLLGSQTSAWHQRRMDRVVFTEVLKGERSLPRDVRAPCAAPFPRVRDKVIVVASPEGDFLVPADFPDYEKALRAAIAAER